MRGTLRIVTSCACCILHGYKNKNLFLYFEENFCITRLQLIEYIKLCASRYLNVYLIARNLFSKNYIKLTLGFFVKYIMNFSISRTGAYSCICFLVLIKFYTDLN